MNLRLVPAPEPDHELWLKHDQVHELKQGTMIRVSFRYSTKRPEPGNTVDVHEANRGERRGFYQYGRARKIVVRTVVRGVEDGDDVNTWLALADRPALVR